MKKPTISNIIQLIVVLFLSCHSIGQVLQPFGKRYDQTLKGDILVIGNNILNRDFGTNGNRANDPYNLQGSSSIYNESTDMKWINIDPDSGNNFNSSSAKLTIPAASQSCFKIVYAALYWSGTYSISATNGAASGADRSKINKVRFKVGTGNYVDLTGNIIYDYIGTAGGTGAMSPATAQSARNPYACMIDVTSYVQAGGPVNYTVGNVASSEGGRSTSAGHSAGWSLFVVYEDPKQPSKFISAFDGFARIKGGDPAFTFPINGFKTIPSGPVKAKIAFTALEGDNKDASDNMRIVGNTIAGSVAESVSTVTTDLKPRAPLTPNIFNSSINDLDVNFIDRVPNSLNTFGFDTGVVELKNDTNNTIKNNETGANITLSTGSDWYYLFFTALAVEVIEPKIILTKTTLKGVVPLPNNAPVGLGEQLKYQLEFQNVGNDNAKNFTITDQLPVNTIFNYPADIEPLQAGVTHTYNSTTRTITFTVQDNLVTKNGNLSVPIRFKVQVVNTCADLTEPCNNIIKNTAKSKYTGEINTNDGKGFGEDSFSSYSACTISVPESTNFLVGVDDCKKRNDVLCGDNVTISATGGYASYSWSTSPTGLPVIGTSQTLTVTKPGTYYVKNTATPPCVDLEEIITVADYAAKPKNPLIDIADNINPATGLIDKCVNDGSVLPKFFLCGNEAYKDINLSSLGATRITWEKTTCVPDPNLSDLCANVSPTCTWTTAIPDGNTFRADTAGQYRVSIYFGGCFSRFYFNVYKNELNYTVDKKDMICGKDGSITINGLGTNYEYSLSKDSGYQSSNTFNITTEGTYTVFIRQVGVATNPCIFEVKNIPIYKIVFNPIAPVITQPLCHDSKGSIKVYGTAYNGAQYTYELFKGGVSIEKVINSTASENEFTGKDAGVYTYTVTTQDGCSYNGTAEIIAPAALTALASITKPLTCANGEITVTPSNGTAPYYYYVNGSATSQTDPKIVITTAGTYSIRVVDKNNCSYTIPGIRIDANPKPEFTVAGTNINCYGANTGTITFNVTNANGYAVAYSIDNGVTYVANDTFSDLPAGTYKPILRYTLSGVNCFETRPDINLTEPTTALSASAGVSELAGCGDVALGIPKNYGKVRITNPQGGTPFAGPNPYLFSFDNQASWTTTNDAYKAPGTYILYVKDANNCIFSAPVILDPEPTEPVINATPQIDFNCDGTATSTVTVENPANASYTYEYYLDNVKNTNTPNNVFVGVASGLHSIRVDYKLNSVPTASNLLFENFGYGADVESPGINTTFYCFERQVEALKCKSSIVIEDGDYSVTARIVQPYSAWRQPGDHTPQTVPPTPKGRCLVVNLGNRISTSDVIYKKVIKDIIPNQPINFELYVKNLLNKNNGQIDCNLAVALVDASGVEISTFTTGDVPKSELWEKYPKTPITLDPKGNTTLTFIIRSNKSNTNGNDVAIDDISVYQLPKTCIASKSFPLTIDAGKAFTAQITGQKNVTCNGLTNGEFTITASNFDTTKGFEYSTNNGVNWSPALFSSPVLVNNLADNLYKVIVRPVGSSVAACAKPFDVMISAPAAVTLSASVTKQATCTTGATITAIGGGGTPAYQYELRQSDGITVIPGFAYSNNGGVFNNVPSGNYTVFVRDANSCQIPVGVAVPVTAPPALTAALATTTDYCYTTANPATLDVEITGGTGPFTYKLDGNAAVSSAALTYSFTNVAPGTHNILVTDSNNCTATVSSIVIAPQIGFTVSLINDLTCLADAIIDTPVVTNGNGGPYTYTVSHNGGTATAVTSFPYTATTYGTYVFTVTDSKGCSANSNTITVTAKTTPVASPSKTDITCNNANDGTITITASGGFTSAYTYAIKLSTDATYGTPQTTNKFTGLAAGTYNVQAIDSKGCPSNVLTITIVNPPVVTASIAATEIGCSPTGTVPALVTVTASGGTGTLRYSFNGNPYTTSNTFSTSTAGPVNALVRDANNCQIGPFSVTIAAPEQFTGITITDFGWDCRTSPAGGHVNIAGTGVSAPKRYSIISGPAGFDPTENSDGEFKALAPGAYVFQVRDTKTNCTLTRAYTVKGTPDIVAGGSITTPILCFGTVGAIQFTVSGLNGHRYDYVVTNTAGTTVDSNNNQSAPTINLTNLPASAYTIVVKDRTTECTSTYTINLTQPTAALSIVSATPTKVFCSNYTSQVTVVATGGTPSYTYAYLPAGSTATPTFASGNVLNINTTNGTVLSWDIYVRDANGCTTKILTPVIIPIDALPTITATVDQCTATSNSFTITAIGTGVAPLTYSLNGGAFVTANTFTNLVPGSYTVRVKDGNGCIVSAATPLTIAPRLTLSAALDKDITCVAGDEPARITLTRVGGSGTFTYDFSTDAGVNWTTTTAIAPFTTNTPGSYIFRVTDSNGCTATTTNPIVVSAPVVVIATETHVDPTCNGFADGSIRLTATAGAAPFTYAIAPSPTTPASFGSANVFGGLAAGTYNYIVRDAKGCDATGTIILNNPPAIVVNIVRNAIQCNTNTPGSFDVNVTSGGTAPYVYRLYDNAFTQIATHTEASAASTPVFSFAGLNFGDYYITVVDANGCEFKSPKLRIETPPFLQQTFLVDSNNCATGVDVEVTTSGGTGPFRYSIFGQSSTETLPLASNVYTFTGLLHGVTYFFQVKDSFNCISIKEFTTPAPPSTINITGTTSTNVTCNGFSNGSLAFTVQDYDATVTNINYEVVNALTLLPLPTPINGTLTGAAGGPVTGNITTLPAGNYVLKVTEATGTLCSAAYTFQITQPAQALTSAVTSNINATCDSGALVTLTTTGGTGPYEYAYAVAPTVPTGGHIAGNVITLDHSLSTSWIIQVRDVNGCTVDVPVTITKDPEPTIDPIAPVCFTGAPVTITVTGTSFGTPKYSINGGAYQASNVFTINAAGDYTFRIQDSNGCEIASPLYTIQPQLTLQANLTADLTCPNPASITLVPAGGTTSYTTLEVDSGSGYGPAANPYITATAGTYKFRVTDSQGCQAESQDVIVTPNTIPTFTFVPTNVTCDAGSDGTITITPANGIAPYTFALTGTGSNNTGDSTGVYTGLPAGSYTVVVTDAKGCTSVVAPAIPISAPAAVTVSPSLVPFGCNSSNAPTDAIVTLTPAGGTSGYTYSFDGGSTWQNSPSFSVNSSQTIFFMVSDSKGCKSAVGTIFVPPYTPPTDMDLTQSIIYCSTPGLEATVTVNSVTGGVGPYIFEIVSPTATAPSTPSAAPFSFTNLVADTYVIKVTDANGCSTTKAIVVEEADKISVTAQLINDVSCNNGINGSVAFTVANYTTPANYIETLSPAVGTLTKIGDVFTYTGLPAGNYTFTITDNTSGCVAQIIDFVVSQPAAALDFTATATKINCNNDEATITVTATGGTADYKYAVVPVGGTPAASAFGLSNQLTVDTNAGTNMQWDVYVRDANGCEDFETLIIGEDLNPSNISVAPFSECPDPINGTYTFTVNPPTGVGPFEYSIGGGFQSSPTFVVNAPGTYNVTVKDANGCPTTEPGLVVIRQPLILTPTVTTPVSCANGDGVIAVSTTGGSGNYEYRIDTGSYAMTTPFTGLAFGTHRVFVRDMSTGCEVFADIDLQQATLITGFDVATTAVTCNGEFDGTITATMFTPAPGVNDNPVYTYTLTGTSITGATVNVGPQDSPLFSGLEASDTVGYTVVVTSARGCTESKTIVVSQPAPIVVPTIVPVQFGCTTDNIGNLATITVDPTLVTGGSSTYLNYEFIKNGTSVYLGPNNTYTEADLLGGSYVVKVYDDKGCEGTSTTAIDIAPYVQLDKVNVVVDQAITCNNLENITVSATTIGSGATDLEYTVEDVIYDNSTPIPTANKGTVYSAGPQSNGVFTNLPVGNYLITVRNRLTNCEIIGVHYVNNPDTFDLTIDNVVDVTCLNGTEGSARVTLIDRVPTPVNNAGEFDYTLEDALGNLVRSGTSTAAGVVDLTNLATGIYTITAILTGPPNCTVSKNFTIGGPNEALVINETHTEITCVTGNNDGSISATASGGWPGGYEFQLEETLSGTTISAWSTTSTFNGLTAGNYVVKARDPRGCEVFRTVVLTNPTPIAFNAIPSTTLLTCKGDTSATITVSAPTGGQNGNYLYTLNTTSAVPMISSGPQADPVFSNLGAGTYTVTVTDGWGCGTTSAAIDITEPTEVVASLVLATTQTCNILSSITLSATGGKGTYTYSADSAFTVSANPLLYGTFATTTTILNVPVGTYRYYVRDVNGCISVVSNDVKIEPLPVLKVDLDVQNAKINCKGDANGVIVATATGGLGNYIYTLLDGVGNPVAFTPVQTTPGNFTQLPAGTYSVRVNSGVDCQVVSVSEVIEEPLTSLMASAVPTPITCNGAANGVITVTASGGTGAIKYAISPRMDQFFDTGVFDQLAPGTYQIIVQDANGCFILLSEEITEPQPIFVNTVAGSEIQEVCFGDRNAAFDINITGGVAPYSVSIDNINGTYFTGTATQNVFAFNGLTGGDHTVYIKDFNGCTAEWLVALDKSVNLDPKASVVYGCEFNSPSNTVTVALDASVDPTLVDFALDGSTVFQASNIFKNVAPGFHTITARHLNTCEKITTSFEVIGYTQLTLTIADGGLNEIVATGAAGAGNYKYSFDGGNSFSTNNKFIFYKSGDYTVMVRDANGCEATATRYFEFIDIKIPNVFTPNGDGNNDTWLPTNTINYKDLTISIFDRYGRKIANLRVGQGWDGRYNSLELPTGDYWYILKLKNEQDDREFVGHFTLMR